MTARMTAALAALLLLPTGATAQTMGEGAQYTPAYKRCLDSGEAAQGVTFAMVACIQAEHAQQDRKLNAAYRAVLNGLTPEQQAKVREAQRAWIPYRDLKCQSENQTGGTIDRIGGAACVLEETIRRTGELQAMLESAEGN